MSSYLRTDLPFGPGNNAPTRKNERPATCTTEPANDHAERARLLSDDAAREGMHVPKVLEAAARLADEDGRAELAQAFRDEAARFVGLPLDFSGGAPPEAA